MAGLIPNEFIDRLIARIDIVEVIDRRVPLTRKGKEYQACCPFHDEKTPSFTVSPSKQFYHCFGCGAHGTAIGFLINYANLSLVEAVQELASSVGMVVPTGGSATRDARAASESPDQLFRLLERASRWFQQQLGAQPQAQAYLQQRGLNRQMVTDFAIGYAPDSRSRLLDALGESSALRTQLMQAGLVSQSDGQGRFYDRFRHRIIFPIADHRGRVVAFGGRALADDVSAKYLNSPATALFHKGAELYGLHRARRAIGQHQRAVVVEGYMDVVSLAQFGVDNAVATLGTATTRAHLQRLFRLAPEVVFCFDGDRAGRDAAWKAMQVALPELRDGRQIRFLFLPEGQDPDTAVRSEGDTAFNRRVDAAQPLDRFLFAGLTRQVDLTSLQGRARLVSLAGPLLAALPPGALRQVMLDELSSLSGLNTQQLDGQPVPPSNRSRPSPTDRLSAPDRLSSLAMAISLLLQHPELADSLSAPADVDGLTLKGADVLRRLLRMIRANPAQTTAGLLESFRTELVHGWLEKLAGRPNMIDDTQLASFFADTVNRLLAQQAEQRRLVLLEKSRTAALNDAEKRELVALFDRRQQQ